MKNFFYNQCLGYKKLDGVPVDHKYRPFLAWFGGMDLLSHVWKFLGLGTSEVRVEISQPFKFQTLLIEKLHVNIHST